MTFQKSFPVLLAIGQSGRKPNSIMKKTSDQDSGFKFQSYYLIFFFLSLYILRERERERENERMSGGGAESEEKRIPSRPCTVCAESNIGLEPTNCEIMT